MRKIGSYALLITGFLFCPCHLPLVLPVLIGVLGGTALGSWVAANTGLLYGLATGYFLAAIVIGLWLFNRRQRSEREVTSTPKSGERYADV